MSIYNLTNVSNSTNIGMLATNVNNATGGLLGASFIIVGWLITMVAMKPWSNRDAFTASTYGWMVITLLAWDADLVGETILYLFIVLTALVTVMVIFNR